MLRTSGVIYEGTDCLLFSNFAIVTMQPIDPFFYVFSIEIETKQIIVIAVGNILVKMLFFLIFLAKSVTEPCFGTNEPRLGAFIP